MSNELCDLVVGCDDGFAETKVVVYSRSKGLVGRTSIPSRARSGPLGTTDLAGVGGKSVCPTYVTEGEHFTVGEFSGAESASFENYPFSAMNRAVVTHALRLAGLGGQDVEVATGLPMSSYFSGSEENENNIRRKRENLGKEVSAKDETHTARILHHIVCAEGLSAFIDYVIDEKGNQVKDVEDQVIAVVDIGGRTTDIAVIRHGSLDHSQSGSDAIGVLSVVESVKRAIDTKYKINCEAARVQKALRTGMIKLSGADHNISPLIEESKKTILGKVLREVNRRIGDGNHIDTILLVGGGAHLFAEMKEVFPNLVIPEDPSDANARGFAKFLMIQGAA